MSRYSGLLKIVRFNWPWYAGALVANLAGMLLLQIGVLDGLWGAIAVCALIVADVWVLVSLAVSHYIYDRSALSRGAWLQNVDRLCVQRAAIFHAGQDEASDTVTRLWPSVKIQAFDFYDPGRIGTASLQRARGLAKKRDVMVATDSLPLQNGVVELGLVIFAAHEIRQAAERAAFFRELGRILAPTGRVILVEHLRDVWNFLAYGPGAFHFFPAKTWRQAFADTGLTVLRETTSTIFVRVFELGKL